MLDFSKSTSQTYEKPETGIYELRIDNVEFKKTKTNKNYISITYVIRNDVEQNFGGSHIWDNIYENDIYKNVQGKRIKKADYVAMSDAEKQTIEVSKAYDNRQIVSILQAQDPQTTKFEFENMEEVAQYISGMCVQCKVVKFLDEQDKEHNSLDYKTMRRTSVPPLVVEKENAKEFVVTDDDLPF